MSEEIKKQLTEVSARLQNFTSSRTTIDKLIESGSIKIIDAKDKNDEPLALDLSGEIVAAILNPVVTFINQRKEQLVNIKERLLFGLEQGIETAEEALRTLPVVPATTAVEAPKKKEVKTEVSKVEPEKTDKK